MVLVLGAIGKEDEYVDAYGATIALSAWSFRKGKHFLRAAQDGVPVILHTKRFVKKKRESDFGDFRDRLPKYLIPGEKLCSVLCGYYLFWR